MHAESCWDPSSCKNSDLVHHVATCCNLPKQHSHVWIFMIQFFWHHSKHWLYRSGRFCMVLPTLGKDAGSWLHAICGTNALLIAGRTSLSTVYLWICWPPCQPPLLMISHDVWKEFAPTTSSSQLMICFYNHELAGRKHLRVKHLWMSIFKQTSSPCHPILEKPCANQTSAWWPRWSSGELHRFVPPWGFPPWEPWICATGLQKIDIPSRFTMIHRYFCWVHPRENHGKSPKSPNQQTRGTSMTRPKAMVTFTRRGIGRPKRPQKRKKEACFGQPKQYPKRDAGIHGLHGYCTGGSLSINDSVSIHVDLFVPLSWSSSWRHCTHAHTERLSNTGTINSLLFDLQSFFRPCLRLSGNRLQDSKGIIPAGKNLGSKKWDRCKDGGSSDSCRSLWSGIYLYIHVKPARVQASSSCASVDITLTNFAWVQILKTWSPWGSEWAAIKRKVLPFQSYVGEDTSA